ncbi:unnamed protein product, partial [Ectocarpus fasciculatus]
ANIDKGEFSGEWRENVHRHPDRIQGHGHGVAIHQGTRGFDECLLSKGRLLGQ